MTNGCSCMCARPLPTRNWATKNKRLATEVVTASEALAAANERLEMVLNNQQQQIDQEAARANAVRDMLDLVPVPLLGVDPDGVIVLANQEAQRVLGHRIAVLGEPAQTVLQQPLPPMARNALSTPDLRDPDACQPPLHLARAPHWSGKVRVLNTTPPRGLMVVLTHHHREAQPAARQRNALLRRDASANTAPIKTPALVHGIPFRPSLPTRPVPRPLRPAAPRLKPHHQHRNASIPPLRPWTLLHNGCATCFAAWMPKARPHVLKKALFEYRGIQLP